EGGRDGRKGDVERARRAPIEIDRGLEHLKGPGIDGERARACCAVETSDVAVRVVEAHERMHLADGAEGGIDGGLHGARRGARDRDLDERPEQRSCPPSAIRGAGQWPLSFSRLRSRDAMTTWPRRCCGYRCPPAGHWRWSCRRIARASSGF